MTHFVDDETDLAAAKSDRRARPPGEAATKYVSASDWNEVRQACYDMREVILDLRSAGASSALVYDVTLGPYSATGDGVADDTAEIQEAIDAAAAAGGGTVYFPIGTYLVSKAAGGAYCLAVPSNVSLLGQTTAGSIIKMAGSQAAFTRPINVGTDSTPATRVTISNLTVDGNKSSQSVEEHRAGIFIAGSGSFVTVRDCILKNNSGDGLAQHGFVTDTLVERCLIEDNDRHGVECSGGGQERVTVRKCYITSAEGIPVNTEVDVAVNDYYVVDNYLASAGICVACDGNGLAERSSGFYIAGNVMIGGVYTYYAEKVRVIGNRIAPDSTCQVSPIWVNRSCSDVIVDSNDIVFVQNQISDTVGAVVVTGTTDNEQADDVRITNNVITVEWVDAVGVVINNATSVHVAHNTIIGPGSGIGDAVMVRSTSTFAMESINVQNNIMSGFRRGVLAWGYNPGFDGVVESLVITGNTILADGNANANGAFDLDYDDRHVVQQAAVWGNELVDIPLAFVSLGGGLQTGYPDCPVLVGGNRFGGAKYLYNATPEGAISETCGAEVIDVLTGEHYYKTSVSGNTGWKLVTHA